MGCESRREKALCDILKLKCHRAPRPGVIAVGAGDAQAIHVPANRSVCESVFQRLHETEIRHRRFHKEQLHELFRRRDSPPVQISAFRGSTSGCGRADVPRRNSWGANERASERVGTARLCESQLEYFVCKIPAEQMPAVSETDVMQTFICPRL